MRELFLPGETPKNSIYLGSYNLKIADTIEQLDAIKQRGIVRSLLIEGLVHMILAYEIQQHTDDINNAGSETGTLSNSEMDLICEVSKLNISEVVYSIGFTSRSYFSKIFRRKYNCSPKQYKDKQKTLSVSA